MTDQKPQEFKLKHFALYSKHWYARSSDVWADVMKCLDDYTPFDKMDVLSIVIRNCSPLIKTNLSEFTQELIQSIHPQACWKNGYFTQDHTWAYDRRFSDKIEDEKIKNTVYDYQTAILYFYMSLISRCSRTELGEFNIRPDTNILPLRENITEAKIQEILLNNKNYAEKF